MSGKSRKAERLPMCQENEVQLYAVRLEYLEERVDLQRNVHIMVFLTEKMMALVQSPVRRGRSRRARTAKNKAR